MDMINSKQNNKQKRNDMENDIGRTNSSDENTRQFQISFCPNCGNKIKVGEMYCSNCGSQVIYLEQSSKSEYQREYDSNGQNSRKVSLKKVVVKTTGIIKIFSGILCSAVGGLCMDEGSNILGSILCLAGISGLVDGVINIFSKKRNNTDSETLKKDIKDACISIVVLLIVLIIWANYYKI